MPGAEGYQSRDDRDVVHQVTPGEVLTVLAGPVAADGRTWWHVAFAQPDPATGAVDGWVAEAGMGEAWLAHARPG